MTIVDSSVWIANFLPKDTQHTKAVRALGGLKQVVCPEYVVLEVTTVLRQKGDHETAARFLELLEEGSDVTIVPSSPSLLAATMALVRRNTYPRLSFVDSALVILSGDDEVLTFDRPLARAITDARRKKSS